MKKLILLVEGQGDVEAVPRLVKRLITEQQGWDTLTLDTNPLRIGGINGLLKDESAKFKRLLGVAAKRPDTGACLILLDGDAKSFNNASFCPTEAARFLANASKEAGGGRLFSVAVVFACREYESWLLAGLPSLAGKSIDNGRLRVRADVTPPDGNLESTPRDAKGFLNRCMESGYRSTVDQAPLTDILDLDLIRNRPMRSFRRLDSALASLVAATRTDTPVVSPRAIE